MPSGQLKQFEDLEPVHSLQSSSHLSQVYDFIFPNSPILHCITHLFDYKNKGAIQAVHFVSISIQFLQLISHFSHMFKKP